MTWSVGVGRYAGVSVRVHLILIVFLAAATIGAAGSGWAAVGAVALGCALLFVSVLLHEFGHCWGAWRVGGRAEEVLLWPLGGLAYCEVPMTPGARLVTAAAGPAVNVILLGMSGVALLLMGQSLPWGLHAGWAPGPLANLFRVNLILLVFNLLPAYPLDGGAILQSLLWRRLGFRRSTLVATGMGKVVAILIFCYALLFFTALQRNAVLLLAIAFFIVWQCESTRRQVEEGLLTDGDAFDHGFLSQGSTGLSGPASRRPSWWQRWRENRASKRRLRQQQQRQQQARRMDEILDKLHRHGMDHLTPDEKAFLNRVSAEYRQQRQALKQSDRDD